MRGPQNESLPPKNHWINTHRWFPKRPSCSSITVKKIFPKEKRKRYSSSIMHLEIKLENQNCSYKLKFELAERLLRRLYFVEQHWTEVERKSWSEVITKYNSTSSRECKLPTGTIRPCHVRILDSSTWTSRKYLCPEFLMSDSS